MDQMAEQLRKGNASVNTMTTYADDDKGVWREFRRDMVRLGIRSSDLRKYSSALRTHLAHLQRDGLLDEAIPGAVLDEEKIPQESFREEHHPKQRLDKGRGAEETLDEEQAPEGVHSRFVDLS
jgi:hypothetical protein